MPTFLLTARDDPFIAAESFEALPARTDRVVLIADHGGHLGFIARGRARFWLDYAIMEWIEGRL